MKKIEDKKMTEETPMFKEVFICPKKIIENYENTKCLLLAHFKNLDKNYLGINFRYTINGEDFTFFTGYSKKTVRKYLLIEHFEKVLYRVLSSAPNITVNTFLIDRKGDFLKQSENLSKDTICEKIFAVKDIEFDTVKVYSNQKRNYLMFEVYIKSEDKEKVYNLKKLLQKQGMPVNNRLSVSKRCTEKVEVLLVQIKTSHGKISVESSRTDGFDKDTNTLGKLNRLYGPNILRKEV